MPWHASSPVIDNPSGIVIELVWEQPALPEQTLPDCPWRAEPGGRCTWVCKQPGPCEPIDCLERMESCNDEGCPEGWV